MLCANIYDVVWHHCLCSVNNNVLLGSLVASIRVMGVYTTGIFPPSFMSKWMVIGALLLTLIIAY